MYGVLTDGSLFTEVEDVLIDRLKWASSVVLNGMVYCGSNIWGNVVIQYDLESGDWREIPTPLEAFALASFNNQLVLAGGGDSNSIEDTTIRHFRYILPNHSDVWLKTVHNRS